VNVHEQQLSKALMLLDRGMQDRAEIVLTHLIDESDDVDAPTLMRALVVLGEVHAIGGRIDHALPLLERALRIEVDADLVAYERARAQELLDSAG